MTAVVVSHRSASALASAAHFLLDTANGLDRQVLAAAAAELDAALTPLAETAAWAPFANVVTGLHHRDRSLSVLARSNVDQLLAQLRHDFTAAGLDLTSPVVQRPLLMTVSSITRYAGQIRAAGLFTDTEFDAVTQAGHPVALAAARLVPAEALR